MSGGVVLMSVMLSVGCGRIDSSNGQAAKPIRPGAATSGPSQPLPHVMLLLPTPNSTDAGILRETIEGLATSSGTPFIYREGFVREGMAASVQAEVISEASRKGVSGMIVAAADPDAASAALGSARDQGIGVVLIGPEVQVEGKPLPWIGLSPPEAPARQVVAALRKRVEGHGGGTASLPVTALLLAAEGQAWKLHDAAAALKTALREAKVPIAATVPHRRAVPEAVAALTQAVKDHPDARLVLFDSDTGAQAAQAVDDDPKTEHRFAFGGFIDRADPRSLSGATILLQRNLPVMADRAVKAALASIHKQPIPDRDVIEPTRLKGSTASGPGVPPSPGTKAAGPAPGSAKSQD